MFYQILMQMRRFRKILVWFVLSIITLFVILFIAASVYINSFKSDLQEILTENVGLETRIDGDISLKVMPGISVVAEKLKIISNETYVLKIEKAEISIDYLGVFNDGIDISALKLFEPQVYIVRDTSGNFNFDDEHQQYTSNGADRIHKLNLSDFSLENGRLLYIDLQYGDTLMIDKVNIEADEIGLTGSAKKIDVDKIRLRGSVETGQFKLNMLEVDSMQFKIDGRAGKIAILAIDIGYFGGKSNGKAILDFTKNPDQITIEHKMSGMDLNLFGESIGNSIFLSGKLDYNLNISFESFNWSQTKQTINGSASMSGENLVIKGFNIDDMLTKYKKSQQFNIIDLSAVFVAGPYGAVFTKGINFAQLLSSSTADSTEIVKLISSWTIKNGIANARDVAFRTNKYRIAMTGNLDFKNDIYQDVNISLLNKDGCAAFRQKINGSFSNPETESINAFGTIFGPVENLWKDLTKPLRRPCTLVYTGNLEHPI